MSRSYCSCDKCSLCLTKDEDVIKINNDKLSNERTNDVIHEMHESGGSVS